MMGNRAWDIASQLLEESNQPTEDEIKSACGDDLALTKEVMMCIEDYALGDHRLESSLPRVGLKVGNYELKSWIDEGGYGAVWLAIDPKTSRKAAVKFLKQQVSNELFLAEFQILDSLGKISGVVNLYDHDQVGDRRCLILEYIEGSRFDRLLESHPEGMPEDTACIYLTQLLNIVDQLHAHNNRIVHGDLTPRNIIIDQEGNLRLIDFGVSFLSGTRPIGHSHDYRVPEVAVQYMPTVRADLFQIGLLGYEMLTGHRYWEHNDSEDGSGACWALIAEKGVSKKLVNTLRKALAWNPEERWESASQFKDNVPVPATSPSPHPSDSPIVECDRRRFSRGRLRWSALIVTALCMSTLLCLGVIYYVFGVLDPFKATDTPHAAVQDITAHGDLTQTSAIPSIAVLEFENNTSNTSMDAWKKGLREFISTDITAISGIRVVERARLNDLLAELKLAESKFIDPSTAVTLGKGLSAHWVLTGSYAMAGEDIRLDIKLISVERGTIDFASSVTGKPETIVSLERILVNRLTEVIRSDNTETFALAVNQAPEPSLEAFMNFSEALAARAANDHSKAKERLRAALKADPRFPLAATELSRIELEVLTIIEDINRLAKTNASEAAEFLRADLNRRYSEIAEHAYDGHYFANLLVISAEMGLFGDNEREMAFLIRFWQDLITHVPPESIDKLMTVVNADIEAAGMDFQKYIDSGTYDYLMLKTPEEAYLKPGLIPDIHWPMYATFWPFSDQLRSDFGQIALTDDADGKSYWTERFTKNIPTTPLDYLDAVFDDYSSHRINQQPYHFETEQGETDYTQPDYQALLSMRLSILNYYYHLPPLSQETQKKLNKVEYWLVDEFEKRLPLEKFGSDILMQALPVLHAIAASSTDTELQERAADIALQITRQVQWKAENK